MTPRVAPTTTVMSASAKAVNAVQSGILRRGSKSVALVANRMAPAALSEMRRLARRPLIERHPKTLRKCEPPKPLMQI
jgi:hypothetical protein